MKAEVWALIPRVVFLNSLHIMRYDAHLFYVRYNTKVLMKSRVVVLNKESVSVHMSINITARFQIVTDLL